MADPPGFSADGLGLNCPDLLESLGKRSRMILLEAQRDADTLLGYLHISMSAIVSEGSLRFVRMTVDTYLIHLCCWRSEQSFSARISPNAVNHLSISDIMMFSILLHLARLSGLAQ